MNYSRGKNVSRFLCSLSLCVMVLCCTNLSGQVIDFSSVPKRDLDEKVRLRTISDEELVTAITTYRKYPSVNQFLGEHIFSFQDSVFGKVPFKVFIPKDYKPDQTYPLVLLLHGGVGASNFKDIAATDSTTEVASDPFYKKLLTIGAIILMPCADRDAGFIWGANKYGENQNPVYKSLTRLIAEVEKSFNVNENKIFVFGHSDGSDGAFAFDVFNPTMFAGFIGYNSMLKVLFADNDYIENTVNRPIYLVHSDKDNLRPIEQTRAIVQIMKDLKASVEYKEYFGYQHFDKHLDIDFPRSIEFMDKTTRNPFPKTLYWQTNNHQYAECDWISLKQWDLSLPEAAWQQEHNVMAFDKRNKAWYEIKYYQYGACAAVKGNFENNVFTISTSRVTKLKILITPAMVDMKKDVTVIVNDVTVFKEKIKPDAEFLRNYFLADGDRKAVWVNAVTFNVPGIGEAK